MKDKKFLTGIENQMVLGHAGDAVPNSMTLRMFTSGIKMYRDQKAAINLTITWRAKGLHATKALAIEAELKRVVVALLVIVKGNSMHNEESFTKIALRTDGLSIGKESVFAELLSDDLFVIRSIPAFIYGVAYGDEIKLLDVQTGDFSVVKHGGNIAIRIFVNSTLNNTLIDNLIEEVTRFKGLHEIAKNTIVGKDISMLLLSLPVKLGFVEIEKLMASLSPLNAKWEYANVYDESGTALNWWFSNQ